MNPTLVQPSSSLPDGAVVPLQESGGRYPSRNIRLSAVLCAIGFPLKREEPCDRTIDVNGARPFEIVTFWHEPLLANGEVTHPACPKLCATEVDAWWRYPGRYTINGYDDALLAMRRALEEREWLLGLIHGRNRIADVGARTAAAHRAEPRAGQVATSSLHVASIIKACDIPVVGFERAAGEARARFVFPKAAIPISELIADASESGARQRATLETYGRDLCIDWMLWALKYADWLLKIVKHPGCIPTIEMRDGDRILRISATMPEKLKREWVSRL